MDRPCDATAIGGFIGAVNFYKDVCPSHAQVLNSLAVNGSKASLKKTSVRVLLNALDSTRFYVGSYARDARLRPSRLSKQVKTTFDHGRLFRRAEAAAMVHHHHRPARRLSQGVLGHPSAKGSIVGGYFATRQPCS